MSNRYNSSGTIAVKHGGIFFAGVLLLFSAILRSIRLTSFISVAAIIFLAYWDVIISRNKILLKYIHFTMAVILFLFGVFVCDNSKLWLGEIRETTYYCGAFQLLAMYYWVFYCVLIYVDPYMGKFTKKKGVSIKISGIKNNFSGFIKKTAPIIVFIFGCILYAVVFRTPFFIYGVANRFEYAQQYISRLMNILRYFPLMMAPWLVAPFLDGSVRLTMKNFIRHIVIPYFPFLLFLIWTGNKFGVFWEIIYILLIPFVATYKINKKTLKLFIRLLIIALITLFGILLLYYKLQGNTISNAWGQITLRIACQGELWWKLVAKYQPFTFHTKDMGIEFNNVLTSIATEGSSKNYGVYTLMNLLGNPATVKAYSIINTRFTACGFELPFYYVSFLAFVVNPILYGSLLSWATNLYINSIRNERLIIGFLSVRFLQITMSSISQGDWYMWFSTMTIIFVVIYIVSEFFRLGSKRNRIKKITLL